MSPSKCILFRREVTHFRHIISAEGERTHPEKVSAVKNWSLLANVHLLRGLRVHYTYYRKFVTGFSNLWSELVECISKID